ncbi:putative ester cyclase [Deinococcus metalli]|uniref:Ester cyclase n=1 Tax=Deinococcus metalli TaxID=1141878 RepID=A0A7W8KEQ8_9DEIO|nr:ester cyclase [Deinococcus metalli]MBB5376408.1 putative ester cyclase [Deinococcus metalli]GHF44290.1 ester cyclase [Deinococcus metalli]
MADKPTLPVFDFADRPDYSDFVLAANTGRRQPLAGFDEDYTDIVDYIVRCTHKIWEEKAIGLIYTHYSHNAIVHTSSGIIYGRETVVRNTAQNIAMWGDLRAYADDVIWSGDDQQGFYTSHRHSNTATQSGYTEFGPPTGRKIAYWGIADCFIVQNRIVEEWLTHDGIAVVRQMGYDPVALAKRAVLPATPHTHGEIDRLPTGQQYPEFLTVPDGQDDPQGFIRAILLNMWNARLVNMVREHYVPNHVAFVPDSRKLFGYGDYENFVITLMASFPDLAITVDHQSVLGDADRGFRVATRCTLQGTHEGYGPYGAPTGRRVFLIVISHHIIKAGKVMQEWTLFDEFALLKQLYGQPGGRGDVEPTPSDAGL